jgi:hypothetical protein
MLKKEFEYYLANQEELVKKYNGKHLVIKDEQVIGAYDDQAEAYDTASAKYEAGTFLIQLCTPGNEAYTQTFHSRVTFA